MTQHLDPAYERAARRRTAPSATARPRRRWARWVTVVLLALTGILLAAGYDQTHARAPQAARMRAELVTTVRQRTADVDALERQERALAATVGAQRARALATTTQGAAAAKVLQTLRAAAAQTPLTGPGVVVSVGDGTTPPSPSVGKPRANPAGADAQITRVHDRDLQQIVNALWSAGAQGISVGGQRLTPTSTIRAAGDAVLVDFRPLSSPYVIDAVGDPDRIQPAFAESAIARSFATYVQLYGMSFSTRRESSVTVPAAGSHSLSFAQPVPTATPSPSKSRSSPSGHAPSGHAPSDLSTPGSSKGTGRP